MWTQLVDTKQLNNIGPENSPAPSDLFVERDRRHAERLEKLAQLRAARLANMAKERHHA
jgi:hypothetical protein